MEDARTGVPVSGFGKLDMTTHLLLNNGKVLHQPDKEMFYYLCRFGRYPKYDEVQPSDLDTVSDQDRELANKMAARMGKEVWKPLIGVSIARIKTEWDLLRMKDHEWLSCSGETKEVLQPLFLPRINVARLTKALHRKRPSFIPVCDSILVQQLNMVADTQADLLIQCMTKLRQVGQANISALTTLRGILIVKAINVTELRILEFLYWVRFGPFGTLQQKNKFRPKCQAFRATGKCLLGITQSPCI